MTVTRSSFHYNPNQLLLAVDLLGTLVFAIEGALAAIKGDLDFFGLMVLSFITAVGGGILRDLLIGDVLPNSIRDWRYGVTAFAGGAAVFFFFFYERFQQIPSNLLMVIDAAGLALFAVAGAGKALGLRLRLPRVVLMTLGGIVCFLLRIGERLARLATAQGARSMSMPSDTGAATLLRKNGHHLLAKMVP